MKKSMLNTLLLLVLLIAQPIYAQQINPLRYEIMLKRGMLDSTLKKEQFITAIDISPDKYIPLSTGNKFFLLGWGGISQFGKIVEGNNISSYAYTKEGLLMAVNGDILSSMNNQGILDTLVRLPRPNMGIAAGKNVIYLFDRTRDDNQYRLYAFAKGGKYKQLLVSPKPISDAVEMNDSLYLAIGSGIFSLSSQSNRMNLVAGFQKESEIRSMAVDSLNNILYIATWEGIYASQNNGLVYVTGDFGGGLIKYFNGGLILFNPESLDIIRIVNIDKSIAF
jgi:hypothetical protein